MRKSLLAAMITVAVISIPIAVNAEPVSTFEAQTAAYGLNSVQYTNPYDGFSQVYCSGQDAYTYTSTNVRTLPDAASDKKATIDAGTKVKLWGYTDNGWSYVYFAGGDGQAASGYIRSDLLDLQAPETEAPQTEAPQTEVPQTETPQSETAQPETPQADGQQIQQ